MNSGLSIVLFPIALGIVMFGLGLSLTVDDFRKVLTYPRAVVVSLVCQMVVLPAIGVGLVLLWDLRPELAVGMMLLAASPGGSTASLYSHLFQGNVALNVSLTAVNSFLALFTLPVIVNIAISEFMGSTATIGLPLAKVVQVFALVLIPVAIGMAIRDRYADFASRMQRPVKVASVVVLVFVLTAAVIGIREQLLATVQAVGGIVVVFNLLSLFIGYLIPRAFGVERRQAVASSFEIGIHNATLAITIALSPTLLNSSDIAMPSAVYGTLMFFTAAAFGWFTMRRSPLRT